MSDTPTERCCIVLSLNIQSRDDLAPLWSLLVKFEVTSSGTGAIKTITSRNISGDAVGQRLLVSMLILVAAAKSTDLLCQKQRHNESSGMFKVAKL